MTVKSAYRADIDGLRAVAVVGVLLFHAFPAILPGGFIGVDVFFVISGFLISRIIIGEFKTGTFTFRLFYERRIRRIFPALAVVLAACLIFGWLALMPFDFRRLGLHIAASAGFSENLQLWWESGDYFDTGAPTKPLLHLWSLGIEEQYYIVWPLLLIILRRHISRALWLIAAVALVSFAANILTVDQKATTAFYLPHTRFWELMIGGILAYVHLYRPEMLRKMAPTRNIQAITGVALLAAGLAFIDETRTFPGWWALLPTLGTALLILSGPTAWVNDRLLSQRAVVFVGLISYPLYLWHWPLLTFARILNVGEPPSLTIRIVLLGASIALAWLTYEFVEKKIRHRPKSGRAAAGTRVALPLGGFMATVGALGALVFANLIQARSASVPGLTEISEAMHDWGFSGNRTIRGDVPRTVVFIGDSEMQQFVPRIARVTREHRAPQRTVVIRTRAGCTPITGIERKGYDCDPFVTESFAIAMRPQVDSVVIAASWQGFIERTNYRKTGDEHGPILNIAATDWVWDSLETTLQRLVAAGKRVVVILSVPRGLLFDPQYMAERTGLTYRVHIRPPRSRESVAADTFAVDTRLRQIVERAGATWIHPIHWICPKVCSGVDERGRPLYKDSSHLRASAVSERLTQLDRFVYLSQAPTPAH